MSSQVSCVTRISNGSDTEFAKRLLFVQFTVFLLSFGIQNISKHSALKFEGVSSRVVPMG